MQKLGEVWASLDKRRQIVVIAAALGVVLSIGVVSRMAATPTMTLLYAGLESGSAGDVVRALEQRGTVYDVRGGSIYVPASQRDELRLKLASEGLPANGGRGYELLDSLNGFGTTSQMFDAAYWRAKEGELARTIVASPQLAQARVHIAASTANPFQRGAEPSASVSVTPASGRVTPEQAEAIRYLVASAVTGLQVEQVAIIDANGRVIGGPDANTVTAPVEDRAQGLRERVLRLVEARVGTGNAVVEVSLDTVTETESIRERRFDPEGRVAISTDVEERSDSSKNLSGDVTVASNLPDGDAAGDESNSQASTSRERVNYEVSETELEILRVPGAVKRLTVAVLVNAVPGADDTGAATMQPRAQEELEALRELVASAVGFDAERGDVITIKSMELPQAEPAGTAAVPGLIQGMALDVMSMVQLATLAVVALVLGLFVIRPILAGGPSGAQVALPDLAADPDVQGRAGPVLTGEIDDAGDARHPVPGGPAEGLPAPVGRGDDAVHRLRQMIGDRQEDTVEILRSWLEESEEKA
ncbi:flagellar M-ring protein FliF [Cribrihabitans marinus]|uniref:Flagellar M-ring protein n=1 Tax=Cribrihabitans marinus TaxID=1227549 RepID=A0A1H7DK14_9RHOB|nr:flagellar basal-body MS-ring/collar protein FliF [Cribrihabitans marinus]GGH39405.1 flagellar M-ring protein [Cribrihabitans marinus]SEK01257.1 flagellar M-ring protein FliF [Cribrihabitans marinus]